MTSFRHIILLIGIFFYSLGAIGQKGGLPLAEEYFKAGEYEKARSIYVNFTAEPESSKKVYDSYLACLIQLNDYETAEKFIRKLIKWDPLNPVYKIDLADLYIKEKKNSEAKKQFERVVAFTKDNPTLISGTAEYLSKCGYFEVAKQVYLQGRKITRDEFSFSMELAEIYKREKNTDEMLNELVQVLMMNQNDKEFLKAKFQDFITSEDEFKKFEQFIISKTQEEPSQYLYNDLLIWVYIQKKEFYRAFIQAKAYDKLTKSQGNKLMELGRITLENKDYETAGDIFDYVAREFKSSPNYSHARKLKIQAKEEFIKNTYPIDPAKIRNLVNDYQSLIAELSNQRETYDAARNMALLYGFYLDSKDTAIILLENIIKNPWLDAGFLAKCKLDLGDMFVLKNEPWEATLIYSQVEKSQKDQPLGNEAKLRNAKLSYYTGQFEIAKEHLDVLKLATHREISNDAMDLSLFIQDNTVLDDDSTHAAMREYAAIELLVFQNKYNQALSALQTMQQKFKGNSLEDNIYYLEARIYRKLGKYQDAIDKLEIITSLFKTDLYGDDAAYMLANIYEENLSDKIKAMELYNKFLVDYPASIYSAEARKRFRALRGDNLN